MKSCFGEQCKKCPVFFECEEHFWPGCWDEDEKEEA